MEQLQNIFQYENFKVRTFSKNGEIWFVAKDVCDILGIKNSRDALSRLSNDEKGVAPTDTLRGKQKLAHVNEFGLYNLIFESRKKEAKDFKRWVTHEVLPSIYKTGGYSVSRGNQVCYRAALREALQENDSLRNDLREYDLLFDHAGELFCNSVRSIQERAVELQKSNPIREPELVVRLTGGDAYRKYLLNPARTKK